MENNIYQKEVKKTNVAEKTSSVRYMTPDGMIFYSREEYLDYVRGL